LIDRTGVVIAGNKVVEEAKRLNLPLRVINTDGTHLIAVQRNDLELATDPRAQALAVADNRVGELNLEWDVALLERLVAEGVDLSPFWTPEEFDALFTPMTTGLTDENAVVEPGPTDIVPGTLFVLGRHRLLCGDATAAEDVARVLDGATACRAARGDDPRGRGLCVAQPDHLEQTALRAESRRLSRGHEPAWYAVRGTGRWCGDRRQTTV
jgi:hypothetical protein